MKPIKLLAASVVAAFSAMLVPSTAAAATYDRGADDKTIQIGQTVPLSGPISFVGNAVAKIMKGYFDEVNAKGGVNNRKVVVLTRDDGYTPAKAVEATRALVENEGILADFGSVGTPTNAAKQRYLNSKQVPQLFAQTGASRFQDAKQSPWTVGLFPNYQTEGAVYAKDILRSQPDAKIAVLYQNDDVGKDYLEGLRKGLGAKAATAIVAQASYEFTDPTVDSQVLKLGGSGANVFVVIASGKFASQAIRKSHETGWKPKKYILSSFSSVKSVLEPAGLEAAKGAMTAFAFKDPSDPAWANDPGVKAYLEGMKRWAPDVNPNDFSSVAVVVVAQLTEAVLRNAKDDLTHKNVLNQVTSMKDFTLPLFIPGVTLNYSPNNYAGFSKLKMARFNGERWELVGDLVSGD